MIMRTIIIGGLVAILAMQGPAGAQDIRIVTVPVHMSDHADPAGLRTRVAGAIVRSCGTYAAAPYDQWADIARCRKQAKAMSERQVKLVLDRENSKRIAAAR